jgi:hypothetical protein
MKNYITTLVLLFVSAILISGLSANATTSSSNFDSKQVFETTYQAETILLKSFNSTPKVKTNFEKIQTECKSLNDSKTGAYTMIDLRYLPEHGWNCVQRKLLNPYKLIASKTTIDDGVFVYPELLDQNLKFTIFTKRIEKVSNYDALTSCHKWALESGISGRNIEESIAVNHQDGVLTCQVFEPTSLDYKYMDDPYWL